MQSDNQSSFRPANLISEQVPIAHPSEILPLFQARLQQAKDNREYWIRQYSIYGDEAAHEAYQAACAVFGRVHAQVYDLEKPGAVVFAGPNTVVDTYRKEKAAGRI